MLRDVDAPKRLMVELLHTLLICLLPKRLSNKPLLFSAIRSFNCAAITRLVFVVLCLFLASCSNTRFLTEEQVLYTGVKKIDVRKTRGAKKDVAQDYLIKNSLSVKSTGHFKLWMHNYWKTDKKKGLKHFIYKKYGKAPVLISDLQLDLRTNKVKTDIYNTGNFDATVTYTVIPKKRNPRKAKVSYLIELGAPYLYQHIIYPQPLNTKDSLIAATQKRSRIVPDEKYNLDNLKTERARIANVMRNRGYYYFKPEYIDILADTIGLNHRVNISFSLKSAIPEKALQVWRIRNIDFQLSEALATDSVKYRDINVHYQKLYVRPSVLYQNMLFVSGGRYAHTAQTKTVNNMSSLGVFKYVNLQFHEADSLNHLFDLKIKGTYLSPMAAELELAGVTKSNDLSGPEIAASLKHNNFFRGGERLSVKLNGAYEWQIADASEGGKMDSYEAGVKLSLTMPRIFTFGILQNNRKRWYGSYTTIQTGVDMLSRPRYFQMISLNAEMNYNWQTSKAVSHSFSPFKVTFTSLLNTTNLFDSLALSNPAVALSFRDQCIPALVYQFTFDKAIRPVNKHRVFWQATATAAGNLVYLLKHSFYKGAAQEKVFNKPYSQFGKITSDFRYYYSLPDRQMIAVRLFGGVVIPYGNSIVVPYTEQFYSGGSNSLRAFNVRSIGPGSYQSRSGSSLSYWGQTGHIKLETNVEYRFPLGRSLYGALFVDIGNIWLYKDDPQRPNGQFDWSTFYKQLAYGTGFGLRYDLDFLVIRADMGIPIHNPYKIFRMDRRYSETPTFWEKLTFYIAIGYPF